MSELLRNRTCGAHSGPRIRFAEGADVVRTVRSRPHPGPVRSAAVRPRPSPTPCGAGDARPCPVRTRTLAAACPGGHLNSTLHAAAGHGLEEPTRGHCPVHPVGYGSKRLCHFLQPRAFLSRSSASDAGRGQAPELTSSPYKLGQHDLPGW